MKYTIHKATLLDALILRVNAAIADGWEPLGGVCMIGYDSDPRCWAQAMVKR